jgi:hypothetical protein
MSNAIHAAKQIISKLFWRGSIHPVHDMPMHRCPYLRGQGHRACTHLAGRLHAPGLQVIHHELFLVFEMPQFRGDKSDREPGKASMTTAGSSSLRGALHQHATPRACRD